MNELFQSIDMNVRLVLTTVIKFKEIESYKYSSIILNSILLTQMFQKSHLLSICLPFSQAIFGDSKLLLMLISIIVHHPKI